MEIVFSSAECTLFGFSIKALWVREASEQRLTLHTLLQMMPAKSLIQFSDKYKALSPSLSLSFLCLFHLWLSYLQFHCNSSEERPVKSTLKSSGLQLSKQCNCSFCLLVLLTVWLKRDCDFQLPFVKDTSTRSEKTRLSEHVLNSMNFSSIYEARL